MRHGTFPERADLGEGRLDGPAMITFFLRHWYRFLRSRLPAWFDPVGLVLTYHRVVPDGFSLPDFGGPYYDAVTVSELRDQLKALVDRYRVVRPRELISAARGQEPDDPVRPAVMLTFDDGYRDVYERVLPACEDLGIPLTIFLSTELVGTSDPPFQFQLQRWLLETEELRVRYGSWDRTYSARDSSSMESAYYEIKRRVASLDPGSRGDFLEALREHNEPAAAEPDGTRLMLSWEEAGELADHPLVTVGSHSHHHVSLDRLSSRRVRTEVARSKEILQDRLGGSIRYFAYPYGDHDHRVRDQVGAAGFEAAFGTDTYPVVRNDFRALKIPRVSTVKASESRFWMDVLESP